MTAAGTATGTAAPTRIQVFLGKGGVGKTTSSAATALRLAEQGQGSLVISTDPTPSLSHIFEITGAHREREVCPNLYVTELGLEDVRSMWSDEFGREMYGVFSSFVDVDYETFTRFVTQVLPGLNEEFMVDYIRRIALAARYRHVVWDTAPLGQTLALLGMPALLADHLRAAPRIYSQLRSSGESRQSVMKIIEGWRSLSEACMSFLRRDVDFSLVLIPEALALCQVESILAELDRHGLRIRRLIVNNVVRVTDSPFLERKSLQQQQHLDALRGAYPALPLVEVPLFPQEVRGVERLREVGRLLDTGVPTPA